MTTARGTFGQQLRLERERRGISLEQLCGETKVNARHFSALEQGDYKALPGGVFRRGIVRAYLHALGLEEAQWMPQFQASHASFLRESGESPEAEEEAWATFALNVKKSRRRAGGGTGLRWAGVAALFLLLVAVALALWHFVLAPRLGR